MQCLGTVAEDIVDPTLTCNCSHNNGGNCEVAGLNTFDSNVTIMQFLQTVSFLPSLFAQTIVQYNMQLHRA